MSRTVLEITPTTDLEPNTSGKRLDNIDLQSASAFIKSGAADTGQCHVQIAIFYLQADLQHVETFLVDDYVYNGHNPSWTGAINIGQSQGLLAIVRSSVDVVVKVVANTQRDP